MKIIDLNLLLYAVNHDAIQHPAAKRWLELCLNGAESVGLSWIVVLGFLRISTNPRLLTRPLTPEQAIAVVDGWLIQSPVRIIEPGPEHWRILKSLFAETGTAGNLTSDAHLAALAIENGAELCSFDADFRRFPRLRCAIPPKPSDG